MDDSAKPFRLRADQIQRLATGHGGCIASDMITVDGHRVGFMYRDEPHNEADSGWRFMAGVESQAYMDDADNHSVHDVNTIANYDRDVIPHLDAPVGSAFERDAGTGMLTPVPMLHPHFPVVEGEYQPTPRWSLELPGAMSSRTEGEDYVLWAPGFTVWITVWTDVRGGSPEQRLDVWRDGMSPDAFAVEQERRDGLVRLGYRLEESRGEEVVNAFYGYSFGPTESMDLGIYFDDEADLQAARSIWRSVRHFPHAGD
jgi:hypothetical protein